MQSWKMRIGEIEARSYNEHLLRDEEHTTIEIIHWDRPENCYGIASFKRTKDGDFNLVFCGGRPFNVESDDFFDVASEAYRYLRHQTGNCCH